MKKFVSVLIMSAIALACSSDHTDLPLPVGTETMAFDACENLRRIGCPEGFGSVGGQSCLSVLIKASELRPLPLQCWSKATDSAAAKGCGSLRCVR